ncbi:MAG: LamG domain-containing protein [Desulfobacterales bacterium]|nr:LamG domain-containing protein [Desulfobacterales bacterium]
MVAIIIFLFIFLSSIGISIIAFWGGDFILFLKELPIIPFTYKFILLGCDFFIIAILLYLFKTKKKELYLKYIAAFFIFIISVHEILFLYQGFYAYLAGRNTKPSIDAILLDKKGIMVSLTFDDDLADSYIKDKKTTLSQQNLLFIENGRFGKACSFMGNSLIKVAPIKISNEGTWAFWCRIIKDISYSKSMRILDANGYWIELTNDKIIALFKDKNFIKVSAGKIPYKGDWFHIALTWGNNSIKIYLNGDLIESDENYSGHPAFSVRNLSIGARWTGHEKEFFGDIDEVIIFNRCLALSEIRALYINGVKN